MSSQSAVPRLALIDYEAGNLRSIGKALARAGAETELLRVPGDASEFDGIVLPGVGAFGAAMTRLSSVGFPQWIRSAVAAGVPLVGVCLGMQLLYEWSEEGGAVEGLGLLKGRVRRLPFGLKVPHMGWNSLAVRRHTGMIDDSLDGAYVYFVHSYVVQPAGPEDTVATTSYGVEFPAVIDCGRIAGLQFHPEKSGDTGQHLLRRLIAWIAANAPEDRRRAAV